MYSNRLTAETEWKKDRKRAVKELKWHVVPLLFSNDMAKGKERRAMQKKEHISHTLWPDFQRPLPPPTYC